MEGIVETLYCTIEREELKRLRKDAERYRFLMERAEEIYYVGDDGYHGWNLPVGDKLRCDAAIDAALLAAQGESHE